MKKLSAGAAALAVVLCFVMHPAVHARVPYAGEAPAEPATVDRLPFMLSSSTALTSTYGWPVHYAIQQTGVVNASFDDYGDFGLGFTVTGLPYSARKSFETPPGTNVQYLFGGALWVGGIVNGDTLVSVGANGWYAVKEFFPTGPAPDNATVDRYRYASDNTLRAAYADTSADLASPDPVDGAHRPLAIRVANRSLIWRQNPLDNAIVYDMVITNIGDQPIEQGYVGYYFDADVCFNCSSGGFGDDVTGSLRDNGIGYVIDNDGDPVAGTFPENASTPKVFAFKFLHTSFAPTDTTYNWWLSNGDASLDFGPRLLGTPEDPLRDFGTGGLGTPVGDANKYYLLRHREWDYDQVYTASIAPDDPTWLYPSPTYAADYADGFDTRFLMSVGPFDLAPDSSVRIIFTTFTADSIHVDPYNLSNLPSDPATYESNLQLNRMVANAAVIDTMLPYLLDPNLPPLGLTVLQAGGQPLKLEWDAWPENTVDGYDIFVTPIDPATFPHPGLVPPWLVPSSPQLVASVGRVDHATLGPYGGGLMAVNVAHRHGGLTGQLSRSEFINIPTLTAPDIPPFTFFPPGNPAVVTWTQSDVDHYNVYKFNRADWPDSAPAYHAFYSTYLLGDTLHELKDSVQADGQMYYFYQMTPYAQVPGDSTEFRDYITDSTIYVVSAVDGDGFESPFATTVALAAPARTRGTLILTNSSPQTPHIAEIDTIAAFYSKVLAGQDYAIFDVHDSVATIPYYNSLEDCPNWLDLMPFTTVIVDDRFIDRLPADNDVQKTSFDRYLASGGRLVNFGGFGQGTNGSVFNPDTGWIEMANPWVTSTFGIDSVYAVGIYYFAYYHLPMVDTVFGFNWAEPVTAGYPEVRCDTAAYPLGPDWATWWPTTTPPIISSFHVADGSNALPIYLYRSLVSDRSGQEGTAVGIRNEIDSWFGTAETYAFGFHLYYMDTLDARALLDAIGTPNASPTLALPDEPGYGYKGVHPQRGYDTDAYEFRIVYSDADGDEPYPGYPRVHVLDSSGAEIAGSPFTMAALKNPALDPISGTYSATLNNLASGSYSYWFEGRDAHAARAAGPGMFAGPIVTPPGGHVLHVSTTGSDETGDGSPGAPFATIKRAAQAAANFDTILVADGMYAAPVDTRGLGLVVMSENGPSATIVDCGATGTLTPVFEFTAFEDSSTVLDGFTFRHVFVSGVRGGAIFIENAAPWIRNCRFENNSARFGGAVYCKSGGITLDSCAFIANNADSVGGALAFGAGTVALLTNCTFVRNHGPHGGAAMWIDGAEVTIANSIISHNYGLDAVGCSETAVTLAVNCTDVFGNLGGDWIGCLAPFEGTGGNIATDPAYCDPANGDFLLTSASPGAPANNTCGVLMGAFPIDPYCPGCCHMRGDADNSGNINVADLTFLVATLFRGCGYPLCSPEADVDGSGSLNVSDMSYLVATLFTGGPLPVACP